MDCVILYVETEETDAGQLPWIRGPRETKERKVGEEDGPLAERDKPLRDRTNEILSPESGLKM